MRSLHDSEHQRIVFFRDSKQFFKLGPIPMPQNCRIMKNIFRKYDRIVLQETCIQWQVTQWVTDINDITMLQQRLCLQIVLDLNEPDRFDNPLALCLSVHYIVQKPKTFSITTPNKKTAACLSRRAVFFYQILRYNRSVSMSLNEISIRVRSSGLSRSPEISSRILLMRLKSVVRWINSALEVSNRFILFSR